MTGKPITGWHVAAIFGSAFLIIISVNATLAVMAVSTFPGLETKNSYVASQSFDKDRRAQEALGWRVSAAIEEDTLRLGFRDARGAPVVPDLTRAVLGRATHVGDDRTPDFVHDGRDFVAPVAALAPGNWNLRVEAVAPDGTGFRQRIVLTVRR